MLVRCRDIFNLPSLKKMKAVAGLERLDRVIRWVHVAEILPDTRDVLEWLQGGELLFVTGSGIRNDTALLEDLVEKSAAKELAGLVIFIGPYIQEIPQQVIETANQLKFPLFELAWEVKLVEATQDICSFITTKHLEEKSLENLMESILFSDCDSAENLIDRASFYGFNLTKSCWVMIVDIDSFALLLKEKNLKDEKKIIQLKNDLQQLVYGVLAKNGRKYLAMLRSDSVILLMNEEEITKQENLAAEIRECVKDKIEGITVSIGVGNSYHQVKDLRKSLKEAEQVLRVLKSANSKNVTSFYKNIGVYRLLAKIQDRQELEEFYQEVLGTLLEYDKLYKANLTYTLEMYLRENGSMAKTAEKLFIHRNTMKYRLQKIEEIAGKSLGLEENRFRFQLALRIGTFLSFQ